MRRVQGSDMHRSISKRPLPESPAWAEDTVRDGMMIRGFAIAAGFFAGSFALHIVGAASNEAWLFILAVALIFISATGFPAIMHATAGQKARAHHGRTMWIIGSFAGISLTASALWAVNERVVAWWQVPVAAAAVAIVSSALWVVLRQKIHPAASVAKTAHANPGRHAGAQ